jgi:hypothetical protein
MSTPEDFATQFDEYFNVGHSWTNLNAAGILDDVLLVIVELPHKPHALSAGKPKLASVNLSGPGSMRLNGPAEWDLARRVEITE